LVRLKKQLGEAGPDADPPAGPRDGRRGDLFAPAASRGAYQSLFQKRVIDKEYEALAPHLHGRDFPFTYRSRMVEGDKFFVMKEVEGEPNSET
jgi:tRNA pseudouridine32 synthase/23S rRNA pseudouridine746 synthase